MPERYGMCAGASNASLGVKLLAQVSAATLLPWHRPQLPLIAGVQHRVRRQRRRRVVARRGGSVHIAGRLRLLGFGICPTGIAVLIQSVVSWHTEQSPVAMRGSVLLM